MIQVARSFRVLCWQRRRRHPWRISEIEELRHIYLRRIPLGQRRQIESCLLRSQERRVGGVIHGGLAKSRNSVISICAASRLVSGGRLNRVSMNFSIAV